LRAALLRGPEFVVADSVVMSREFTHSSERARISVSVVVVVVVVVVTAASQL